LKVSEQATEDWVERQADVEIKEPGVPTLAPPREEMADSSASQGVPPVPVDVVDEEDLAVEPAAAEAPISAATDPAVEAAVAEAPVAEAPTGDLTADGTASVPEDHEVDPEIAEDRETPEAEEVVPGSIAKADGAADPAVAEPSVRPDDLVVQEAPRVPVEEAESEPTERTALRQPIGPSGVVLRQHLDLDGLSAQVQAKRLTAVLHRPADDVGPEGKTVDLETCLQGLTSGRRRAVIEAYWEASLRAAQHEAYRKHTELLDDLHETVTAVGSSDAIARLRAARLDADADLLEAENRLLTAQHELTQRCGRSLDGRWLLPTTLPHAGNYRLRLESQPRRLVESWTLKRLAAIIPALGTSLADRAQAVVEADSIRTQTVAVYRSQGISFNRVLSAVDEQTKETLAFLDLVGAYNQSIADYVTAVVPAALPEEQLVATLVVR
jgi:hypothetical protein